MFLDLDAWMVRLFGDDERPMSGVIDWYLERRDRVRDQIESIALDVVGTGTDVVLEPGFVRRIERLEFYDRMRAARVPLRVVCVDAPRDVRRQRVVARNTAAGPLTQVVPEPMFEAASDAWEPPEDAERTAVEWTDL